MIRTFVTLVTLLFGQATSAETIRLAVTTSFENSGLADVLLPALKQDTGLDVQLLVVGTGQALRLGAAGDVHAVLVHAKAAEEAFVAAGHATHRTEIMYNDFILIGPSEDPALIEFAHFAHEAFFFIANTQSPFVSRGDTSGTHTAELAIWSAAEEDPATFGPWYKSVGAGMGATLNTASGLDAYTLSDRASWINFGNKGNLRLLFDGDPALFNQYSFLPINTDTHPHLDPSLASKLEDWLTSPAAQSLINGYNLNDEQLFTFNAAP